MQKKLTIVLSQEVYEGLHHVIGEGKIGKFIEKLVRPHVVKPDLDRSYQEMAAMEKREQEALEWAEGTIEDIKE